MEASEAQQEWGQEEGLERAVEVGLPWPYSSMNSLLMRVRLMEGLRSGPTPAGAVVEEDYWVADLLHEGMVSDVVGI